MGSSPWSTILLIALMVVAFYFLLLRPQKKRQQAQQKTMSEIQPGTQVLLGSGIFGTVVSVGEKRALLETAPGVQVTVLKQAIARIVQPGDEFSEPEEYGAAEEYEAPEDASALDDYADGVPEESAIDEPRDVTYEQQPYGDPTRTENPSLGDEPKKD